MSENSPAVTDETTIYTSYRFQPLEALEALRERLESICLEADLRGTVLLAEEGINLTLSGDGEQLRSAWREIERVVGFALEPKISRAEGLPFRRLRVRRRSEIVTFGRSEADPGRQVGEYVDARRWNALLEDPEVLVLDTRNDYEVAAGRFPRAVDPGTTDFVAFADFVEQELAGQEERPVAMYCTGGIRCEKASSYLLAKGWTEVYHLEGGILRYLETSTAEQNRFEGECFVFDDRVTLDAGLRPGRLRRCVMCGWTLDEAAIADPRYELGVSCPRCHGTRSADDLARARERQRQAELRAAASVERGVSPGGEQSEQSEGE